MDPLGNVVRELLREARAQRVLSAAAYASVLKDEGMKESHIEEMLYAGGFDKDIVDEAMRELSTGLE